MANEFEAHFIEMSGRVGNKASELWTNAVGNGAFSWAAAFRTDLHKIENYWYEEVNTAWGVDMKRFEKSVLVWGRAVLSIYKAFSEREK